MIRAESYYYMICGMVNKTKDESGRTGIIIRVFLDNLTGCDNHQQVIGRNIAFKHAHAGMLGDKDCFIIHKLFPSSGSLHFMHRNF